ncbi:MAG: ABC transporter ATP-binding protein [Ilumatobacter sp.]|uniref:ABC transporter ATP-binding protein n=1 Tax=Ilumatobacter sp. TaxID=1967498 RepID=UPI003298E7C9
MSTRRRLLTVSPSELRRVFRAFRPALSGMRSPMLGAVILALAVTALELLKPWPITWVIDHLTNATEPGAITIEPVIAFAAVAFAVPALMGLTEERLQLVVARISRKATVRIRSDVFEHIHRLDYAEHQRHFSGDLLIRLMGDVNMICDLLFPSWLTVLSRGSVVVGGTIVFALVDWRLLNVALLPVPLLLLSVKHTSSRVKAAAGKSRKKEGAMASRAAESIRQVGIVKAFSAETRTVDDFRSRARSAERSTMAAARHAARMGRLTEILTGAGVAAVLVLGAMRVRDGFITPGQLVLAISYTRMIYKPIRKLTDEAARLAKATACALRVLDLLEQPAEDQHRGEPCTTLDGDIEFDDIGHRYHDGRVSLTGFSATIRAGSLTAVTGENGTGKSTLIELLLRLQRPTDGTIRIAGRSIDEYELNGYREQISFVPQQLTLFSGTIRDNIAFGNPDASGSDILAAAEAALLLPVVERLPDGIDTRLDEDGASLSGGEARRVMLARAAVRRASILLLDEPLVGLDPDARSLVVAAIRNIGVSRTTLIVHHGDLDELEPDDHLDLDARLRPAPTPLVAETTTLGVPV